MVSLSGQESRETTRIVDVYTFSPNLKELIRTSFKLGEDQYRIDDEVAELPEYCFYRLLESEVMGFLNRYNDSIHPGICCTVKDARTGEPIAVRVNGQIIKDKKTMDKLLGGVKPPNSRDLTDKM